MNGTNGCESCERLQQEIEQLRRELDSRCGSTNVAPRSPAGSASRTVVWWFLAIAGWATLTIFPVVISLADDLIDGSGLIDFIVYGVLYSAPWAQSSILICFLVLLRQPIWQRALVFAIAAISFVPCWWLAIDSIETAEMVFVAPIAASVIAVPLVACRMLRRWQLMHHTDNRAAQPASITSYLIITAVVAILTTSFAWIPQEVRAAWLDWTGDISLIGVFASPIVAACSIPIVTYGLFLRDSIATPATWAIYACILVGICLMSLASPTIIAFFVYRGEELSYAAFGVSWGIAFSFCFLCFAFLLRNLGYRLRTMPITSQPALTNR